MSVGEAGLGGAATVALLEAVRDRLLAALPDRAADRKDVGVVAYAELNDACDVALTAGVGREPRVAPAARPRSRRRA